MIKAFWWFLAFTFLWFPFVPICYVSVGQIAFSWYGSSEGVIHFTAWAYPFACMFASIILFPSTTGWKKTFLVLNMAAIPLWALALYIYVGFVSRFWK